MITTYHQTIQILSKTTFDAILIGESFVKPDFDILVVYVKTSIDRAIDVAGGRDVKVWSTNMSVLGISYGAARVVDHA